jgi:hypothetical protein
MNPPNQVFPFAIALSIAALLAAVGTPVFGQDATPPAMPAPPKEAHVRFLQPLSGSKVTNPVKLRFSAVEIDTDPAGESKAGSGHFVLILDALPHAFGEAVPSDANHIHFDNGEKGGEVNLEPGLRTLTLQFADGRHRSYGPQLRETIVVEVVK